jgi:hypothetical protein
MCILCNPCISILSQYIVIQDCDKLTTIPPLPSVVALHVANCPALTSIDQQPSLGQLTISNCDALVNIGTHPSLWSLNIGFCKEISNIQNMPTVEILTLKNCRKLTSIPSFNLIQAQFFKCPIMYIPDSPRLQHLRIIGCHSLLEIPYTRRSFIRNCRWLICGDNSYTVMNLNTRNRSNVSSNTRQININKLIRIQRLARYWRLNRRVYILNAMSRLNMPVDINNIINTYVF